MAKNLRMAVDIGGTFVDALVFDFDNGTLETKKVSTTPKSPHIGVLDSIKQLVDSSDTVGEFIHGTTLGLNAILERKGAAVGIVTNDGFRDIFELARGNLPFAQMYEFDYEQPENIVPRFQTVGVRCRINNKGEVVEPLDLDQLKEKLKYLVDEVGVDAIAVSFLHSYANSEHEIEARDFITKLYPEIPVSVGSEIAREYREYERTSTAVLDGYIKPVLGRYLLDLQGGLEQNDFQGAFHVMRSGGGAMTVTQAKDAPLLTVLSGPAGGVVGTQYIANETGRTNLISLDIGGTSLDTCVFTDGRPSEVYEADIDHMPVLIPIFDIRTIGAGGGSIAWLDQDLLKVGPQSAGAAPGPACYDRGGNNPTVTDAALVLGYLRPEWFLNGEMSINQSLAEKAIEEMICQPLKMSIEEAASSIFRIMVSKNVAAVREITVERGLDPREFSLVGFGGGGPMFAPMIALELDIPEVLIPPVPALFSAWGMLTSDLEYQNSKTILLPLNQDTVEIIKQQANAIANDAEAIMLAQVEGRIQVVVKKYLSLRYQGQEHTLDVEYLDNSSIDTIEASFNKIHSERYGHQFDEKMEVVSVRSRIIGKVKKPDLSKIIKHEPSSSEVLTTRLFDYSSGEFVEAPVVNRESLIPDQVVGGPMVIKENTAITVIHSSQVAVSDQLGLLTVRGKK
ncbi:MAG: methylhydantoinase [Acidiferrobacteraceae bacterium]|nr:methylhydantoinase [Acidiferrobacteraceae bacterium]